MSGLPAGWATAPVTRLASFVRGVTYTKSDAREAPAPGLVGILRANNIGDFRFDISDLVYVPERFVATEQKLRIGDVVIATSSGSASVVGKAAQVRAPMPLSFGAFCGVLRPVGEIEGRYFGRYFQSEEYRSAASAAARGVNINNLKRSHFDSFKIPFPARAEQERIADKLDALFDKVNACRERLDRVPQILKKFREAVLEAAVSGRLTERWRSNHGFGFNWIPTKLSEVGELGRGKSKHRPRNDPRLCGGPYPFIQTGDVARSGGTISKHEQTYSELGLAQSRLWPKDTLCITIAANIADTAILTYPACFPDSVVGFIADQSKCSPSFMKWSIDVRRNDLKSFAPATAQKNINLAVLNDIEIPLPTPAEQLEIVRRAKGLLVLADNLQRHYEIAGSRFEKLTPSVLVKAFRAELVPHDPNDEPAAKLLKRIADARNGPRESSSPKPRLARQQNSTRKARVSPRQAKQ